MKKGRIILNGIINENPTFVLFLGMCPVLATSGSIYSALGMSVCVFLVLLLSNIIISLVSKITPDEIRIPVYIIIIATIVSAISMFVEAFASGIYSTLGSYLQLIVVNCIILGRAEAFASKNKVVDSIMDAIGISIGFLMAMFIVALFREVIGTGCITMNNLSGEQIFQLRIIPEQYCISLFNQPAGAFLVLGVCVAVFTFIKEKAADKKKAKEKELAEKQKVANEATNA